ncbi:g11786 [Coccomyxa elongata]
MFSSPRSLRVEDANRSREDVSWQRRSVTRRSRDKGRGKLNRAALSSILWELGQGREPSARQIKGARSQGY